MGALRTARTTGLGRTPGLPAGEKKVTSRWPGTRTTTVVLPPRLLTPLSKYSFKTVFRIERRGRLRQDDQLNKNNNRGVVTMASYTTPLSKNSLESVFRMSQRYQQLAVIIRYFRYFLLA